MLVGLGVPIANRQGRLILINQKEKKVDPNDQQTVAKKGSKKNPPKQKINPPTEVKPAEIMPSESIETKKPRSWLYTNTPLVITIIISLFGGIGNCWNH